MATQNTKRKILFPVDSSANCERAFRWFLANLLQPQDVLYFFHIIEPVYSTPAVGLGMESPPLLIDDMTRVMKESVVTGKKLAQQYMRLAKDAGVRYKAFLHIDSKPGQAIVRSANEHNITLIVIGSRGLGAIKRTFLGSVSDYIVHNSSIPVIIVPPKATVGCKTTAADRSSISIPLKNVIDSE
ncbi:unnamed protein product [Schistocephalus solidus]|uniref:Usp domain-containing protein n=1 Tax=Schistocephalus solidus TaxID=70667 RepID=A0A183SNG9_SCHSO|nr:unnamed protein product [Schistocephalus solidus]